MRKSESSGGAGQSMRDRIKERAKKAAQGGGNSSITIPRGVEFWRPLVFSPGDIAPKARGAQWVFAICRLRPDVDLAAANSAMATVAASTLRNLVMTNPLSGTMVDDKR